jgi:acetyl esterase/lipase
LSGGYTWYKPQDQCYRAFASNLAAAVGMPLLAIDYRKGDPAGPTNGCFPDHTFPAAIQDSLVALKWLADNVPGHDNPSNIKVNRATQLFLAGDSAGGGMTLAMLLAIRDSNAAEANSGSGSDSVEADMTIMPEARGVRMPDAAAAFSPWADLSCSTTSYVRCENRRI